MQNSLYTHNDLKKSTYLENTNNYILKINSKDRNFQREPNPFNFNVSFNKYDIKYSFYYRTQWWNQSVPEEMKVIKVNNGAVIEDSIEEIKQMNVPEIVTPRFIPLDDPGHLIKNVEVIKNTTSDSSGIKRILLKGLDDIRINFINDTHSFVQIIDNDKNNYYLFRNQDVNSINSDVMKNYCLYDNFYTSKLYLNGEVHIITDISDCSIKLDNDVNFIKSNLYLLDYYSSAIHNSLGGDLTFSSSTITITNSENLISYNFVKNSILNVNKDYYFTISNVSFLYNFTDSNAHAYTVKKTYPNLYLTDDEYQQLKSVTNGESTVKITTTFTGSWYKNITGVKNNNAPNCIFHYSPGVRDLLDEKLFYLSMDPFTPPINLSTDNKLNNTLGVFYPSSSGKDCIILKGQIKQTYTHRNLQNLGNFKIKLYYMDGAEVGKNLSNYPLEYLQRSCKQCMFTLLIDQVDRHFN